MNAIDTIVGAFLAALRDGTPVCPHIDEDIDAESVPETLERFIVVRHENSTPLSRSALRGHPVEWNTDVAVECYARGDSRAGAGRASRALLGAVYARLMQDPSLGGVVMDLYEPVITTDSDKIDRRNGCTIGVFTTLHRTQGNTLET